MARRKRKRRNIAVSRNVRSLMQNPHLLRAHTRPIIDFILPFSTFRYKLRGTLLLSVLILGVTHAAHAQQTDSYRLDIGDVLELAVVGLPDLNKRLMVDLDGYIEIPGYGSLKVA